MWDTNSLYQLVHTRLKDYLFIIVSNREPYIHSYTESGIKIEKPPSGLTVALDPIMQASGGIWIAHGSGNADQAVVDQYNKVNVPPENPKYSLKRVWLSQEDEEGYYYGFANEALWPLCHIVYNRPVFRQSDWESYKKVNQIFAQSVLEEIDGRKAFVFIQDYQLALVAKMIREQEPSVFTAQFWHIPWPNPEAFRICPWQNEILEGLLSNDLFGFHIRYHCNNFMDTVNRALESRVDFERYEITYNNHTTSIMPFPISVDFEDFSRKAQTQEIKEEIARLKKNLGLTNKIVGLGIERFDYTKGIPDRLRAIERFFQNNPEYINKVVFIQAGVTSRIHIAAYKNLNQEVENMVERINTAFGTEHWKPIILLHENLPQMTLLALRKMADFCIVSALHDGMNLVAKEFVASRYDEDGVLILSTFTGSARELTDALLVNPFATDLFADSILEAVKMPLRERKKRMKRMRNIVRENNIYKWAGDIISELVKIEFGG